MSVEETARSDEARRYLEAVASTDGTAPDAHDGDVEPDTAAVALGARLRELRTGRELTLEALATTVGVSRSLVSAIELGRSSPSLTTLRKIAAGLEVPMAALFTAVDDAGESPDEMVVRLGERKRLSGPRSGVRYELLTPDAERQVEFLWAELEPGMGAPQEATLRVSHTGEENVLVVEGEVLFSVDGKDYELASGDSISFDCSLPHRVDNRATRTAKLVVAITPPTF